MHTTKYWAARIIIRVLEVLLSLAFGSGSIASKVMRWHVLNEVSITDHGNVKMNVETRAIIKRQHEAFKSTDWESYGEAIEVGIRSFLGTQVWLRV